MPASADLVAQLEELISQLPWWRRAAWRLWLRINGWPDIVPRAGGCGAAVVGVILGAILAIIVANC